jgi:hypothetical protein
VGVKGRPVGPDLQAEDAVGILQVGGDGVEQKAQDLLAQVDAHRGPVQRSLPRLTGHQGQQRSAMRPA